MVSENVQHFIDAANADDQLEKFASTPNEAGHYPSDEACDEFAAENKLDDIKVFQAKQRAERKELFRAAQQADIALLLACDADDEAVKDQKQDQIVLRDVSTVVNELEAKAKMLDDEIKRLQIRWRATREAYGKEKDLQHNLACEMATRNPIRTRETVVKMFKENGALWDQMPTSSKKKHRDKAARKRAQAIVNRG